MRFSLIWRSECLEDGSGLLQLAVGCGVAEACLLCAALRLVVGGAVIFDCRAGKCW